VPVGDLVNDSYLRFRPAETVDLTDPYLWLVIWQAHRDVRRAFTYFKREQPSLLLTSYATYVQHGVAVRCALLSGVQVYSFGNLQQTAKQLTSEDWVHTRDPRNYAADFKRVASPGQALADAERLLAGRLAGEIDPATAYMRVSSYRETDSPVPDVSGAVVVFLHDFFDSPHCYHGLLFPDFWTWVERTVDVLQSAKIPFFLKPHPNQVVESDAVIAKLRARFPAARFIAPSVTNVQLARAGMRCAVTVYGTIAHEMAFLGIPTIACARHPHVAFDFCTTCLGLEQYDEALRGALELKLDPDVARRQSLEFVHMHNASPDDDSRTLRDALIEARFAFGRGAPEAISMIDRLASLPGFQAFVAGLAKDLRQARVADARLSAAPTERT
jgi:hypothetical protein